MTVRPPFPAVRWTHWCVLAAFRYLTAGRVQNRWACGLGEVTAEGFAGGTDGCRGLGLGFAFAGGEQFDGAPRLLGDSAGLVDGLDGRSGLDGGE